MKPQLYASAYERLRGEAAWSLLTAHLAPVVLALLQHLLYANERVLPASVLIERLHTELGELRAKGRDLPGSASYYVDSWRREGWIERRLIEGADEEEFELTAAALAALKLVSALQTTRAVATESRLALVIGQLAQLAEQTDANAATRMERLLAERARIDQEIARISGGQVDVLSDARAAEKLAEIVSLASELSDDFRRVRDDFARLNRDFRERIIHDESQRGELLTDLFNDVDVISQSAQGQSFEAFWSLLVDPEESARLEAGLREVAARPFAEQLGRSERRLLRRLTRTLLDGAGSVHGTRTRFAKSLRGFVQSKEYREQRRLSQLLRDAKARALEVAPLFSPSQKIGFELELSSATYRSISRLRPHDPVQAMEQPDLGAAGEAEVDLLAIANAVAESDIDFRSLAANIKSMLTEVAQCSIGDAMAVFTPQQGLGTVIGYVALGVKHGDVAPLETERVSWLGGDGTHRSADIPLIYFLAERLDELPG